jgi:hypothetical protein
MKKHLLEEVNPLNESQSLHLRAEDTFVYSKIIIKIVEYWKLELHFHASLFKCLCMDFEENATCLSMFHGATQTEKR